MARSPFQSHCALLAFAHPFNYQSTIRSDEGLTLKTSAFNLFTVANLPYQLN